MLNTILRLIAQYTAFVVVLFFYLEDEMDSCYMCGAVLNQTNQTKEHIFLKAFGDELSSTRLLCKSCNNILGEYVDGPIVNQLKPWLQWLGINGRSKEKAKVHEKNTNYEYLFNVDTNEYKLAHRYVNPVEKKGKTLFFSGTFRDESDVKNYIESLRQKYPTAKFDKPRILHSQIENPTFEVSVGTDIYGLALEGIKMACEFALYCKIDSKLILFPILLLKQHVYFYQNNLDIPDIVSLNEQAISAIAKPIKPPVSMKNGVDKKCYAKLFTQDHELFCIVYFANLVCFKVRLSTSNEYLIDLNENIFYTGSVNDFNKKYAFK